MHAEQMWTQLPIVGFDTETTGIKPDSDRLVTASVVVVESQKVSTHYWLANPGVEIPQAAQRVHGISTQQAMREGTPIEEVLDQVAGLLESHLKQGHPVVAFNASFDLTLIEAELSRHKLPTLTQRLGRPISPVIDPYLLDKTMDRYRSGKRNLESVAKHYGVWKDDAFHNAEADVMVTLRVLGAIIRQYPQLASTPLEILMESQRETHEDMEAYFAQKRGLASSGSFTSTPWPVALEKLGGVALSER